jgi:NADH-quinone oxidoreductase subunit M
VTLSSIAVPLTNGFVGEFLILMGAFTHNKAFGSIAVMGVILGAAYMLWMVKRVFFGSEGELIKKYKEKGLDINTREFVVLLPLVILIFWMGIYPKHFLSWSESSVNHLSKNINNYSLDYVSSEEIK